MIVTVVVLVLGNLHYSDESVTFCLAALSKGDKQDVVIFLRH